MNWTAILIFVQIFFGVIIGLYFWGLLRSQRTQKVSVDKESKKEFEQLQKMRKIRLSEPLSEKARPQTFDDIIGQKDGVKALRAALCGPNPQHIIVYGPPGVGKTAAARLVLEEAKKNPKSPFRSDAKFVELDGTTARFDERGIADPLIGSVHDPIYQGAGAMGQAGIPQPKQGAVTNAHGGVLFIDEIGELHPIQLNKLLKVLEDRKVILESAYYSEENPQIPRHIHDIFQNGLPADFRLIGATTRTPEEIPPAIRSRCLEVFFGQLKPFEIEEIVKNAVQKVNCTIEEQAVKKCSEYARNGRQAVGIIQIASGLAIAEERKNITVADVEWVVHSGQMMPRLEKKVEKENKVGFVHGLGVFGPNIGALLDIEVTAMKTKGTGTITMTGIVEEESMGDSRKRMKRKSMAKGSIDNVFTVLKRLNIPVSDYDIHINFPGGMPVDGPSAGIAIATAVYSAIDQKEVPYNLAMTGEISIHGNVKPVGGIVAKVEAAIDAGIERIFIPKANELHYFKQLKEVAVIPVQSIDELFSHVFEQEKPQEENHAMVVHAPVNPPSQMI